MSLFYNQDEEEKSKARSKIQVSEFSKIKYDLDKLAARSWIEVVRFCMGDFRYRYKPKSCPNNELYSFKFCSTNEFPRREPKKAKLEELARKEPKKAKLEEWDKVEHYFHKRGYILIVN